MNYLKNFYCKDKKGAIEKINSILTSGQDRVHLTLDFDRTLTQHQNKLGEDVTTWRILGAHLNEKTRLEFEKLYNKYRPLEIKNKMKLSDAAAWWTEVLNLYKESKLKLSDIMDDVEQKMPMRPGTKELFDVCDRKGIPAIIISAGIKDVIELWCRKFKIKPAVILSTNLFFDSEGFISGWDKKSLVHILNKKEKGHREITNIRKTRPNTILIGDSLNDASMVGGFKKVLRIIVDNSRIDDLSGARAFYDDIFKKFDLIIKNKSLFPVVGIIKRL